MLSHWPYSSALEPDGSLFDVLFFLLFFFAAESCEGDSVPAVEALDRLARLASLSLEVLLLEACFLDCFDFP